jgi:hypothetical protein
MTMVILKCRDHWSDAETISLKCELNARGYVDFDGGAYGKATYLGDPCEFDLFSDGVMDFGKDGGDDRRWRTDLHQLEIRVGKIIAVRHGWGQSTYEIVQIR